MKSNMEGTKRKTGAQPGNTNALKHGCFYSRRFNPLEVNDLDVALREGVEDEIALLRVTIRRVFDLANEKGEDPETWFKALSTLGLASTRLAGLVRTQELHARRQLFGRLRAFSGAGRGM